jgi:hypothetical protein
MERCPDCDGRVFHAPKVMTSYFDAMDVARGYADTVALAHGHLKVYERKGR